MNEQLHHLSIDLETYSEVSIGKAGSYRYILDPSFEILLFACRRSVCKHSRR